MDPATSVARRFDDISSRCQSGRPVGMSHGEQTLWYVVATRCEKDINGIASVFDQLLSEKELLFLIAALEELQEPEVAQSFRRAHAVLCRVGFYERAGAMCNGFGQELQLELQVIDAALDAEGKMWALDEKLAELSDA